MNQVDLTQDITIEPQQTRRSFLQTAGAGAGSIVLGRILPTATVAGIVTLLASCGERVLGMLSVVISIVGQAGTLFSELGLPKGVEVAGKIAAVAKQVDAAIRGKNFKNAFELFDEILKPNGLFDQILIIAGVAQNDAINKFLVAAKFTLSIIASFIQKEVEQAAPSLVSAMATVGVDASKAATLKKWAEIDPTAALH